MICRGTAFEKVVGVAGLTLVGALLVLLSLAGHAEAQTACVSIGLGATVSGEIALAGERDCYSFRGTSGSRVRVSAVETAGAWDARQDVIRPNGTVLCSTTWGSMDCTLDATGSHRVVVYDNANSRVGKYNLYLQRLNSPPGCAAIAFDAILAGAVTTAAQEVCYSFSGAVGARVRLNAVETSGSWDARQEVIRPNGTVLCGTTWGSLDCTLDAAGAHAIFVYDNALSRVGSYNVYLQRLTGPAGCAPIAFGATAGGSIATAGDENCYSFSGSSGDRIRVNGVETSGSWDARQEVIRPNGTVLCSTTWGSMDCTLDAPGVHRIFVYDNALSRLGGYTIYLQRLNNAPGCAAIAFDGIASGALGVAAQERCHSFTGAAGNRIRVNGVETSGSWDARQEVIRPNGTVLCSTTWGSMDCTLDAAGAHTIFVSDNALSRTGQYNLYLQRLVTPPGCAAIDFGNAVAGSITAPADENCYSFTGVAGDRIRVNGVETSGSWDGRQEVIRPNGTVLCSTTWGSIDCTLDATGAHSIFVYDNALSRVGTYRLYLQRLNSPPGCTAVAFDDTVSSSIAVAAQEVCHFFTGAAGDRIRVNGVETSGSWDARQEVIRPDGTVLCNTTWGSMDCPLDADGVHAVFVYDNALNRVGSYNLYLQRLTTPAGCAAIAFGSTVSGSISAAADENCYSLTGSSGDRIRVNGVETSGSWDARQEVVRPNGTVLCSTTWGSMDCTLDAGGVHTILVYDNALSRVGSYNVYLQRLVTPAGCAPIAFGESASGSIAAPSQENCYSFTGATGTRIRVGGVETSGSWDARQEVIRPNGTVLCSTTWGSMDCTLDAPGPHTIFVYDNALSRTGNYNVSLACLASCDPALVTLSISDAAVTREGQSGTVDAVFTVSLSFSANQMIAVDFATADGTAMAGSDYLATSGTLTFAPGETAKTIRVPVNGDVIEESTEGFLVNLSLPVNATIVKATGTATIVDDDGTPTITFTVVPPYGSFEDLHGQTTKAAPADHRVAVYIRVGNGWWTKPYWAYPATTIASDGSWTCDITTGGIDERANTIVAYLIPATCSPDLASGQATLPDLACAVAKTEVIRPVP